MTERGLGPPTGYVLRPRRAVLGVMAALVLLAAAAYSSRMLAPVFIRGDLLYHAALANEILRGQFPPGGPYAGLPAYYPPGFHVLLAAAAGAMAISPVRASEFLHLLFLPLLPIATYLLTIRVTGRRWVAVLAVALTLFGGGYDIRPERLWVNSFFMGGVEAYPLYPRDIVFGLLPIAVVGYLAAIQAATRGCRQAIGLAVLAGMLFALCGLVQVQLLLPIPFSLATVSLVMLARHPKRRRAVLSVAVLALVVAALPIGLWLAAQAENIVRNEGVAIDSAETLLPARIPFWGFARQFGVLLPLAIIGCGVVLLFLRRADGPRPEGGSPGRWRPDPAEAGVALIPWLAIPFVLAIAYAPTWPLEDALRPQRLWLLSGQPMAILAAIGLAAAAEHVVSRWWGRQSVRLVVVLVAAVVLAAGLPATLGTIRVLSFTWTRPEYAHLDLARDRVPEFGSLLDGARGGEVVLTYEDWSSLVWYETGLPVVAVKPPGYAKLAFDPRIFTARSQDDRRSDIAFALRGDPDATATIADRYEASVIVLARRESGVGLVHQVASVVARRPGGTAGIVRPVEGNGWDAVALDRGARLSLEVEAGGGEIDLSIRFQGEAFNRPVPERRVRLLAGHRPSIPLTVPPSGPDEWQVVEARLTVPAGDPIVIEAVDPVIIQSVMGFRPTSAVPGWHVVRETPVALVLRRSP